jgi:hypothetical protein
MSLSHHHFNGALQGELLRSLTQLGEWISEQSLRYIQSLYEIESEVRDPEPDLRGQIR